MNTATSGSSDSRHTAIDDAQSLVEGIYRDHGWRTANGMTEDARRFEDLRQCAKEYVSRCRLRVLRHVGSGGDCFLDMASGPIQYPEYLTYSRNFKKRYCVDLSLQALTAAKALIGEHGEYLHGSFLDLELDPDMFDCTVSLHTIYHIHEDRQEEAVRKLLRVTKPGAPVIVVYSNPNTLLAAVKASVMGRLVRWARTRKRNGSADGTFATQDPGLYFHPHPISWWDRFRDVAEVEFYPWRSFDSNTQKRLFPDNFFGRWMLTVLFRLEDRIPHLFVHHFTYPMVVLRKRA